uniref:Uncharacterized protein n=1 Tax=Anopheles merus TaxID=30066 RepID=A0A182VKZ6_ANOME
MLGKMVDPTPSDLEALVDEAIALPDGVINCTELNRLLKYLVEEPEEPVEEEGQEQPTAVIQCGVALVCEPQEEDTSPKETAPKGVTSEALLEEIDAQASQFQEQETKLLAVIGDLKQRLEKIEQLFYQKLERLSNEFQQFQQVVESKQNSVEETTSTPSVQQTTCTADQIDKLSEFTDKLDELQRQMELLLSHRDQLPLRIEALLEEKLREGELMTSSKKSLQTDGGVSSRKGSITPSRSCSQGRIAESAGTTQPASEKLSCLSCDTNNVGQRKRDGRYLAPRTSAKLAMIARRLEESDAAARLKPGARWSRTCGGSYTVVKPDERVFRQVNVQFNRTMQGESSANDS